jgi:acetyltransferase
LSEPAVSPYPNEPVTQAMLADGSRFTVRPIRPDDAGRETSFIEALSARSRHLRFHGALASLTPAMLARFTQVDYQRDMAFVAIDSQAGQEQEIAVARYFRLPAGDTCEFAIVVADAWQRRGLGRLLLSRLIAVARSRGMKQMLGHVLAGNPPMLAMCTRLGFEIQPVPGDPNLRTAVLALA